MDRLSGEAPGLAGGERGSPPRRARYQEGPGQFGMKVQTIREFWMVSPTLAPVMTLALM